MKNDLSVFAKLTLLCQILLLFVSGMGQNPPGPSIESPNVATLDKFESIPVDLATGTPDISIPIHTLHFGSIDVPIALRYHQGALRVAEHESWVGMGWDLQSGGSITRTVRGEPDEYNGPTIVNSFFPGYYPVGGSVVGAQLVNGSNTWSSTASMLNYFVANGSNTLADVSADEFTFNFMGHSGKFYYEGSTLGWQVASDENIQVQMNSTPMLTGAGVISTLIGEYPANVLLINLTNVNEEVQTQVFSGFVLTVPDGTRYYFGGVNSAGNGTGIEFYCPYGPNSVNFNANTWLLTKIVDVDGNEVDFNYSASYPVADLGIGISAFNNACSIKSGMWILGQITSAVTTFTNTSISLDQFQGILNLPLYLDNITCNNETISFNRAKSTNSLRLPANIFTFNPSNTLGYSNEWGIFKGLLGDGQTIGGQTIQGINNIQWMMLNAITITNGNGQAGPNGSKGIGQVYRQYSFNYSSNSNQRLTLMSFQESDDQNNSIEKYSFGYNSPANLPDYRGDQADHWGYYNGSTVANVVIANPDGIGNSSIYAAKMTSTTNNTYVITGTLSKITYPTGGYVSLSWDPHYYSQVVSNDRTTLNSQTGTAGGCRIREIQSYLANNTLVRDKKYFYVRGYSNANPINLTSSGILNGTPTYNMTLSNRKGADQKTMESVQLISVNSLGVYGYNAEGSYIGYDQVVEMNEDNSYTINYFTTYGPDLNILNNPMHYDKAPPGSLGWIPGDNYYPITELDLERGKLIKADKFTANDMLVQRTVNTYRSDAGRFNSALREVSFNNSYSGCALFDALVLASAYYKYAYDYYVVSKSVTTYDQNGKNPLIVTTGYQYNANNLVSVKTETDSKGETIVTTYKYPPDLTDATSQAMTAAHILTPVMQTSISNNGLPVNTTTLNYYSPNPTTNPGMYKPQTMQVQIGSNPVETRQTFYAYDSYGNVLEMSKTNDIHEVYLWGYFGQYPVAKITGATLSQVCTALGSTPSTYQAAINAVTNTTSAPFDPNLRSLLTPLRSITGTLVTDYTYLPLSGITSETNPRNMITSYQYDNFQRLQMITDNDGNVLKTFTYNYEIPQ